jgi:hypothetical protein
MIFIIKKLLMLTKKIYFLPGEDTLLAAVKVEVTVGSSLTILTNNNMKKLANANNDIAIIKHRNTIIFIDSGLVELFINLFKSRNIFFLP